MVAALSGQEKQATFQDVDAGAWCQSVEELHTHGVHFLLSEVH